MFHVVLITRGQTILFFCKSAELGLVKIWHDFSNKEVLKVKLAKNHFIKNVLVNFNSSLKKIRKIRIVFYRENSLSKSNFGTFWRDLALQRMCKKNTLSSGNQYHMGYLILTTSPWSIFPWITLLNILEMSLNHWHVYF